MKITVAYSSKAGLRAEYQKRVKPTQEIPTDFFAEGDDQTTIEAVIQALREGGHTVQGIEADDNALQRLTQDRPELVFNIAEGLFGDFRESYIPMLCERIGLPYTGSDPLTLAICLNKARTKEILSFHGIPTAAFKVFYPGAPIVMPDFHFPAIVKPIAEGSSKGIFDNSVVADAATAQLRIQEKLATYQQAVMLEKFLSGDEFTVAVWGNGAAVEVLPIVAINYQELPEGAHPIFSYEAKWIWDTSESPLEIFQCPAQITPQRRQEIETIVRNTYSVLGIRDWCRIDVRYDEFQKPQILELNPLPGILPRPEDNSCFPKAAFTAGYTYSELLNRVVQLAAGRTGIK